ncbi:hypothetical protein Ddye_017064 [Dipteronia dyeriana]|uniref:Uncharacterized protein n=1 Tax=Dipteronia dyeriana TaxID=168575 RepID=A0AAD9X149_9ROSI|nr:hypothetical protein Ddye_017064 [Dipteronia dyeriana]
MQSKARHFKVLSNRHVIELYTCNHTASSCLLLCSSPLVLGQKTKAEFECGQISRNQKIIKMQSRLATTATRFLWVLSSLQKQQVLQRNFVPAAANSTGRTADSTIHSGEHHGAEKVTGSEAVGHQTETEDKLSNDIETEPRPKPPRITSQRLQSIGLNHPLNPNFQQKRRKATTTTATTSTTAAAVLEDVSCVGLDGTPFPGDRESEKRDENEKVEDDREYYKHRKPSSLSEMEMADTRKPITQATSDPGYGAVAEKDVIGWKPEQLVCAEETLMRAAEFWRQNAMRGDPDTFPHSMVLRELRGEWF